MVRLPRWAAIAAVLLLVAAAGGFGADRTAAGAPFCPTPGGARTPPCPPHRFYVVSAPAGAAVSAINERGESVSPFQVKGQTRILDVDPSGAVAIRFRIDGAAASGAYNVVPGGFTELRLDRAAAGSCTLAGAGASGRNGYTVQPGDTLSAIAVRFGTTTAVLADVNGLANPNLVQIGQVLILPAAAPPRGALVRWQGGDAWSAEFENVPNLKIVRKWTGARWVSYNPDPAAPRSTKAAFSVADGDLLHVVSTGPVQLAVGTGACVQAIAT